MISMGLKRFGRLGLSMALLWSVGAVGAERGGEGKGEVKWEEPVLITPAGQSADAMIMKVIAGKAGLAFRYSGGATVDSLEGHKSIWLVAGGSSKGLGAAGVDVEKEKERIKRLAEAAHKKKIPVAIFHVGGEARRGPLSDPFNRLAAENGQLIVVVEGGDQDSLFARIAQKQKATYRTVAKQGDLISLVQELYRKASAEKSP